MSTSIAWALSRRARRLSSIFSVGRIFCGSSCTPRLYERMRPEKSAGSSADLKRAVLLDHVQHKRPNYLTAVQNCNRSRIVRYDFGADRWLTEQRHRVRRSLNLPLNHSLQKLIIQSIKLEERDNSLGNQIRVLHLRERKRASRQSSAVALRVQKRHGRFLEAPSCPSCTASRQR